LAEEEKTETITPKLKQQTSRQLGFPMPLPVPLPGANPMFPRGEKVVCYIPYSIEIMTPKEGVLTIILVKKLSEEYGLTTPIHEKAMEAMKEARKKLWKKWENFRKELENNQINISKEISKSCELSGEIDTKKMWKIPLKIGKPSEWDNWKEPQEVNLINKGRNLLTGDLYPVGHAYPEKTQVVGLAIKYERKEFNTIYDMTGEGMVNNYWEFVTEYVRNYGIAVMEIDWDNPESWGNETHQDIPPTTFNIEVK